MQAIDRDAAREDQAKPKCKSIHLGEKVDKFRNSSKINAIDDAHHRKMPAIKRLQASLPKKKGRIK